MLHVSIPMESSSVRSHENFKSRYTKCELPNDDFLGIETCSIVECHLLNIVVFDWRVLSFYVYN